MKGFFFIISFILISVSGKTQQVPDSLWNNFNYKNIAEIALGLQKQGKIQEALEIHYSIMEYLEKNSNQSEAYYYQVSRNYQKISNLYLYLNDSLSITYIDKAIEMALKTTDTVLIEQSYSHKYYCLYNVPGDEEQLNFLADKCIEYSVNIEDKRILGEAYMHKCNALVELGMVEEGDLYCRQAEAIFSELESGYFLSSVLGNIANVFVKSEQFEKALSYHQKAFDIAVDLEENDGIIKQARNLASDYYRIHDFKKSSDFYKIAFDSTESYYENLLDEKFTEAEAKFNTAQKDKEIAIQDLKIAEQKQSRDAIIFISIILLLAIMGIYQWYLQKHKKKKDLVKQELIKEQELNEQKKRFLENIAHEIRTPITLINGYLALSLEKLDDKKALEKHIKSAIHSSKKVMENANEILEMQKLESGNLPINKSDIHLESYFKRIFFSFSSLAELKSISMNYQSSIADDLAIHSDENRIEKILNNLISNALKFSNANSKVVFKAEVNDGQLSIQITDFGIGIPIKEQKNIFKRFYQTSVTSIAGGIGVGLSLSHDLAISLGGNLTVESETEKGSTFTFKLPVETFIQEKKMDTGAVHEKREIKNNPKISLHEKTKILVVEDNPEMNTYLQEILCQQFSCDTAYNGIDAFQLVQSNKYSLILSDVMMPKMDGMELKQRINNLDRQKSIPFVFITAKAQSDNKIEGYQLGVDDYITKPFRQEELMARINNILMNKKEREKWVKENPELIETNNSAEEQLLEKIKSIIRKNLSDESFKVVQIADEVGYSSRQLNRLLKQMTGLTPVQFVLELRLQKAYLYLSEKKYATLSELRYEVGMPGAANFNKKFLERFGVKPSEVA
jgi:signal transduction histidine kinase/CheY-like chemotaxis protein